MMSPLSHDIHWNKRITYLLIGTVFSALLAAGWFGYRWYVDRYEQLAYKDLALSIDGYHKALGSSETSWSDVEQALSVGAERHRKSSLYPYFIAYKADALVNQGKQAEALEAMRSLVSMLTPSHPLYYLYATKFALMKLDSSDEKVQKEGRQELVTLSKDSKNTVRDMALYYSGLDISSTNKEEAKKIWNEIAKDSSWNQLVQARLR